MTITTIDAELAGMMFMAEGHRLVRTKIRRRDVSGAREANNASNAPPDERQASDHEKPQPGIGSRRKNLGHPA